MEKYIIEKNHTGFELRSRGKGSLIQKKYAAAMRTAEELLTGADLHTTSIQDCLNCGKLTRLLNYMKNGSVVVLLMVSYTGFIIH